jgi:hypothetical protein
MVGLGFLMVRRRVQLRWPISSRATTRDYVRFSIRNLLLLTAHIALVLMFVHLARDDATPPSAGKWALATVLGIGIFFGTTVLAALAALSAGRPAPRIAAATAIAGLLGVAFSFALRHDDIAWWLVPCGALITIVPTLIVAGSLLAVRSCGYRLVPRCR